jgi:hypothetical protein
VFVYISLHLWSDADETADIWNGRWSKNTWYDVLQKIADESSSKQYDFTMFRKWMKILTTTLFETQSALSRYRFWLIKRLGYPLSERS